MVVRELRQDVAAFWKSMKDGAARIQAHDPGATFRDRRLAGGTRHRPQHRRPPAVPERISGRRTNTTCRTTLSVSRAAIRTVSAARPGSHVRRANPRDGLAPTKRPAQTLLDAANNHRILRRGRKYGPTIAERMRATTARSAACCSSASTPTSPGSSSSSSRPGCSTATSRRCSTRPTRSSARRAGSRSASSRCAGSSRSRRSSGWPAASISSCRACRPSTIWRRYERPDLARCAAARPQPG